MSKCKNYYILEKYITVNDFEGIRCNIFDETITKYITLAELLIHIKVNLLKTSNSYVFEDFSHLYISVATNK